MGKALKFLIRLAKKLDSLVVGVLEKQPPGYHLPDLAGADRQQVRNFLINDYFDEQPSFWRAALFTAYIKTRRAAAAPLKAVKRKLAAR